MFEFLYEGESDRQRRVKQENHNDNVARTEKESLEPKRPSLSREQSQSKLQETYEAFGQLADDPVAQYEKAVLTTGIDALMLDDDDLAEELGVDVSDLDVTSGADLEIKPPVQRQAPSKSKSFSLQGNTPLNAAKRKLAQIQKQGQDVNQQINAVSADYSITDRMRNKQLAKLNQKYDELIDQHKEAKELLDTLQALSPEEQQKQKKQQEKEKERQSVLEASVAENVKAAKEKAAKEKAAKEKAAKEKAAKEKAAKEKAAKEKAAKEKAAKEKAAKEKAAKEQAPAKQAPNVAEKQNSTKRPKRDRISKIINFFKGLNPWSSGKGTTVGQPASVRKGQARSQSSTTPKVVDVPVRKGTTVGQPTTVRKVQGRSTARFSNTTNNRSSLAMKIERREAKAKAKVRVGQKPPERRPQRG